MRSVYRWLSSCFKNMVTPFLYPFSFSLNLVDTTSLNISNICSQPHRVIQVRKLDLIRSIVRYGYRSYFTFPYPTQLRLLRIPYVFSVLDFSNTNLRVKADVYSLETTEKSYISYELGMIFAHLIAESCLNLKWTLHLNLARSVGINIQYNGENSKPDLIGFGFDVDDKYYVIEAKGTLSKCKLSTIRNAIAQLRNINTVKDRNPQKFVSYFVSLENQDSKVLWIDPEKKGNIDIGIDMKDFVFLHYFNFMRLMQSFKEDLVDKKIHGCKFKVIPLGNICIGLEKEVFGKLRAVMASWSKFKTSKFGKSKFFEYDLDVEFFKEKVKEMEKLKSEINEDDDNISLGRDGSIVKIFQDSD